MADPPPTQVTPSAEEIEKLTQRIVQKYEGPLLLSRLLYLYHKLASPYSSHGQKNTNGVHAQSEQVNETLKPPETLTPLYAARDYLKAETWDWQTYTDICKQLNQSIDSEWVSEVKRLANIETVKWDNVLHNLEANEFGDTYGSEMMDAKLGQAKTELKMGQFLPVQRALMSLKEYSEDADFSLRLTTDAALCSLLKDQHQFAKTLASKEVNEGDYNRESLIVCQSDLLSSVSSGQQQLSISLIYGLALMTLGDYVEAVGIFLKEPGDSQLHTNSASQKQPLLTVYDLTVYIALLALATFSRNDLKFLVDKDHVFAKYLESATATYPEGLDCKQVINDFLSLNYRRFFQQLDEFFVELGTDLFLGPRLKPIYDTIRRKSIVQYLAVFDTVPMAKYYEQFNGGKNGDAVEQELAKLIRSRELPYCIDHETGTIVFVKKTGSLRLFKNAEKAIHQFLETTTLENSIVSWLMNSDSNPLPHNARSGTLSNNRRIPDAQLNTNQRA